MRKIIFSFLIISVIAVLAIGGTMAFFSDNETSRGNTYSAGTVEISINDELHWTKNFTWTNFEPGDSAEFTMIIKNEGENPVKLWQLLKCLTTDENGVVEPEQSWYDTENSGQPKNDIDSVLVYEMFIDGQMVIAKEAGITMDKAKDHYLGLIKLDPGAGTTNNGILAVGDSITVVQKYYFPFDTTNWAQSDKLNFTLELEARQIDAPEPLSQMSFMENKYPGEVALVDTTMGILKYDYMASTFNYDFLGVGLNQSTEYCLIYYADGWPGNNPGYFFQSGYPDSTGKLILTGQSNININLPNSPDTNYPTGAKIWLVNCANYDKNSRSVTGWSPNSWLFDNWPGLINYRQGDRPNETITCEPTVCADSDGDGYGVGEDRSACPYLELDCDDTNPNINPGNGTCSKTITFTSLAANLQYGTYHDYDTANVSFTYTATTTGPLIGQISATGLKPFATYQLKFEATPVCQEISGDNALNETIGYLGRWWNLTDNTNINSTPAANDAYYLANSIYHGGSKCIQGYLVWDYITADASGNVTKNVTVNNSYHVLWCSGGTCGSSNNSQLQNLDGAIDPPGFPYCDATDVNGQIERATCNTLTLPARDYHLKFILNEESFHQNSFGNWTAVMASDIDFTIE